MKNTGARKYDHVLGDRLWFVLCDQTVVCPVQAVLSCMSVCLSVTFVHCGQTVGRIKMKLGKQVGLGSGHIVLDGDPAPPPQRGQ